MTSPAPFTDIDTWVFDLDKPALSAPRKSVAAVRCPDRRSSFGAWASKVPPEEKGAPDPEGNINGRLWHHLRGHGIAPSIGMCATTIISPL